MRVQLQPAACNIVNLDAQSSSPYQATLSSRSYPEEEHFLYLVFLEQQQFVRRRRRAAHCPAPQEPIDYTAPRRRQRATAAAHRIERQRQYRTQRDTSSKYGSRKLLTVAEVFWRGS